MVRRKLSNQVTGIWVRVLFSQRLLGERELKDVHRRGHALFRSRPHRKVDELFFERRAVSLQTSLKPGKRNVAGLLWHELTLVVWHL